MSTIYSTPTARIGSHVYHVTEDHSGVDCVVAITNEDGHEIARQSFGQSNAQDAIAALLSAFGKHVRDVAKDEAMEAATNAITALA